MSNFLFWYDVLLRMLYYFAVLKQYRNQKLRVISNTCKHLVLLELYTLYTHLMCILLSVWHTGSNDLI